ASPAPVQRPAPVTPRVTSALDAQAAVKAPTPVAQPVAPPSAHPAVPDAGVVVAAAPVVVPRAPWANPFVGVLAVVGVLAIGVGVWAIQKVMQQADAPMFLANQSDYVLVQTTVVGA